MVRRDIAYADDGHERHKLDVYAPSAGDDHPIVVWIHGGGWRQGNKTGVQSKPQAFVENGYVFVSVNYRLAPDVTVKEMAGDIAKAIKWVHDHASNFGGSTDKVFVMGHSAGAHLAALVCTDERYLKAEGLSLSDITGCVPVDTAAYDVVSQVQSIGPLRSATYTAVFGNDETSQRELSPMAYVAEGKGIPSFLILHVANRVDSTARSRAFAGALKQAGVDAKIIAAEGKNHGTINRDLGQPDDPPTKVLFEFVKGLL
jgi:acetyl esterase/lipase